MDALPLWVVGASLALNAIFLRRLLTKLDTVYNAICGTPGVPGLEDRTRQLEAAVFGRPMPERRRA